MAIGRNPYLSSTSSDAVIFVKNFTGVYCFGFNGKESDSEGMGGGLSTYDYGFRIYNPSLGKFLSVDPLFKTYAWYTPYQYAGNMPINSIDLDGLEQGVIVRWYNANGKCTGQTIFAVTNANDRPLGQNNFLFMNLPDTQANHNTIDKLGFKTSTGNGSPNALTSFLNANSQGSAQPTVTDFQGNPVNIQSNGGLTTGLAFTRNSLCIEDQRILNDELNEIRANPKKQVITQPTMVPDVIYFSDESSVYESNLDPDSNGFDNDAEMNQALKKLNNNPDKVAFVTGNASREDKPGGLNNNRLSAERANTTFNLLRSLMDRAGVRNSVTNNGGAGAANASTNPEQNADGQQSLNRNATISYDIPLQTR